jgi:hypothetical protein
MLTSEASPSAHMEQTSKSASNGGPATLQTMAAAACMPLECAAAIAEAAAAKAAKGFVVWLPFVSSDIDMDPASFAGRVFTSLEKSKEAFPDDDTCMHVPYRMHNCGEKNVVYVYVRDDEDVIATNIAEDLENQLRAMPNKYGGGVLGKFEASAYAYRLDG